MDATRKKELERLIWKDRLKRYLPVVAGVIGVVIFLSLIPIGAWEKTGEVTGTLVGQFQDPGQTDAERQWIVELEDGERKYVPFTAQLPYEEGRRVVLQVETHSNHGGQRYNFARFAEEP